MRETILEYLGGPSVIKVSLKGKKEAWESEGGTRTEAGVSHSDAARSQGMQTAARRTRQGDGFRLCVLCHAQSHLTLCDPMDSSQAGTSVHGIFQARTLGWVAMPSHRRSSQPRDRSQVSHIAGDSVPSEPPGKPESPPWASQKMRPCRHLTSARISDLSPLGL